jgi:hypothetical protein
MTTVGSAMEIHRLLDEAFAGIAVTPELQDLKEEMRANLVVRVTELEATGLSTEDAAGRAIRELGDIRSLVDDLETPGREAPPWVRHRVRPKPSYVVRTVVQSVVGVAALTALVLPAVGVAVPIGWQIAAGVVVAMLAGVIVADALRQETTTNYPVPVARALGYGGATVLALVGAGSAALWLRDQPVAWLVGGGLTVLLSVVGFTYLGATQTNRHKAWVVRLQTSQQRAGDRFTDDPAAAARFGLYTATIWLVAIAAFAVLSFTVGWAWSWLALLAGVVVMMMTLARMLFVPTTVDTGRRG